MTQNIWSTHGLYTTFIHQMMVVQKYKKK